MALEALGNIFALPQVGGLHHRYTRVAAYIAFCVNWLISPTIVFSQETGIRLPQIPASGGSLSIFSNFDTGLNKVMYGAIDSSLSFGKKP